MKVDRKPLKKFTLFSRLPMKSLLLIWEVAAINYPIVKTMITDDNNCDMSPEVSKYRARPSLMHVETPDKPYSVVWI